MAKLMWTGSDTLYSTRLIGGRKFPSNMSKYLCFLGYTIFAKIADLFVEKHYVVAEHLKENLKPLGLKKQIDVLIDPPRDVEHIEKIPHTGFNVLYYRGIGGNQVFNDWVYGHDVIQNIESICGVRLIEVNGNSDMDRIYPIVDIMIRPNRSDGNPRMIMECKQLGIPYYWSKENPNRESIIKFINDTLQKA